MQRTAMRFQIALLEQAAARRPAGYVENVMRHGKVHNGFVELSREAYSQLCKEYRWRGLRGLGDLIARITGFLHIKQCGGCKRRQRKLNRWFPF